MNKILLKFTYLLLVLIKSHYQVLSCVFLFTYNDDFLSKLITNKHKFNTKTLIFLFILHSYILI